MSLYNQNRVLRNNRVLIGKKKANLINLPELIEIQLKSFEWFLQRQNLVENGQLVNHGLHQLFQEIFPNLFILADRRNRQLPSVYQKLANRRINEKIRQYANEFVLCFECGKPDTKIEKDGELTYMKCTACGAKNFVKAKI